MSRPRWAADGPLLLLALVGLAFALGLAWLGGRPAPAIAAAGDACAELAATVVDHWRRAGAWLPWALLGAMLIAASLAFGHQLWVTRAVLRRVLIDRRPLGARLRGLARATGLDGRLDLVADDRAFTFCFGFWRPRVCLSTGLVALLDDQELAAVLRHEAHHLRHRDPLKILLGRSLASLLFFLPLAGALRNGFLAGKELCADAEASRSGGEMPLARALYKLLRAERPIWPAGVLAVGAFSPTEARLRQLIEPGAIRPCLPSATEWLSSLAIVAGILGFSTGSALAAPAALAHTSCESPYAVAPGAAPLALPPAAGRWLPEPGAFECDARCLDSAFTPD